MSLRRDAVKGASWSMLSLGVRRAVGLVTSIVLARLLSPVDFGLMAMVSVFMGFLELLRDMGTGAAVIQKREVSEELLSSLFWVNLAFGLATAAVLFVGAPAIVALYQEPALRPVVHAMAIVPIVSSISIVHASLMSRALRFLDLAKIEMAAALASSGCAIAIATLGWGVWSLVVQVVVGAVLVSAGLWLCTRWFPQWQFSRSEIRGVLTFSLNLTGFNLLNYFARSADNLLIGWYLGPRELGYYDLAYRLMLYPLQAMSWTLQRVMFPVYARLGDDVKRIGRAYLKMTGAIAVVTFPMMLGLAAMARPFVYTVFGPKWEPMIPLMWILCPLGALQSILTTLGPLYQARGRTDLLFRWGALMSLIFVGSFVAGLPWGSVGVAGAYACACVLLTYPILAVPLRLVALRVRDLGRGLWRTTVCAAGMVVIVLAAGRILSPIAPAAKLFVLIAVGVVAYALASWVLNRQTWLSLGEELRHMKSGAA